MLYYILTILMCFIIELNPGLRQNKVMRTLLTLWLYGFLCFGYMIGSDWRSYELDYQLSYYLLDGFKIDLYSFYYYLSEFFKYISEDFFVFKGVINVVYLHSVFYVVKRIFGRINFVAIIFLFQILIYMLISGPLKFLCSSIFIMYATGYLLEGKIKKWLLVSVISVFFHFTSVLTIIFIFLVWKFRLKIIKIKTSYLFISYFILLIFTTNISFYEYLFNLVQTFGLGEIKTSKILGYNLESVDNIFSLGSLKNSVFFLIVLFNKDKIINFSKHGVLIFTTAISYSIIFRILFVIPIGFRITMYSSFFFIICLLIVFYASFNSSNFKILFRKYAIIALFIIPTLISIWQSYEYVPYSNSLQYITIRDHLPYNYRFKYNYIESEKRTGIKYNEKK